MTDQLHPTTAFKIETEANWDRALARGTYPGSALDVKDGFIHLSSADQVAETLALYFAGQTGLVLIEVDLAALGEAVVWEASRGGAMFPHIYGPLPLAACSAPFGLHLDENGKHILPVVVP
jgi:uncharacterized protein (DUF952 family)